MSIIQKRHPSFSNVNGYNGGTSEFFYFDERNFFLYCSLIYVGSIIDFNKQVRPEKAKGRLRMLVEQLPNGRKRLHLKGSNIYFLLLFTL